MRPRYLLIVYTKPSNLPLFCAAASTFSLRQALAGLLAARAGLSELDNRHTVNEPISVFPDYG